MIKKLWPYTSGYRKWIIFGVLCSAGEAVFELLLPLVMADIVDTGIPAGDTNYILTRGALMVCMAPGRARASAQTCARPSTTTSRSFPSGISRSSPPPPW